MDREAIIALLAAHEAQSAKLAQLMRQLDWFKRQLFGEKSERRFTGIDAHQLFLGEWSRAPQDAPESTVTVPEHRRRRGTKDRGDAVEDNGLRFDESVPIEEIRVPNPALENAAGEYEVIGEKTTYRLAQRPGSYVILKFVRTVIKLKSDGVPTCPPAPAAVLGKSVADVSFLAGLLIDKFRFHLPLYRQHQRLEAAGIRLARSTLTSLVHQVGDLLRPIADAQWISVLESGVLAMDEIPIKAGRKERGKMRKGYFWPVIGDRREIVFSYADSRESLVVRKLLNGYRGILLTDGYKAYEVYVQQVNDLIHAQCWSHTRRQFVEAENSEPALTTVALGHIRQLYAAEDRAQKSSGDGSERLRARSEYCRPIVDAFFEWLKEVQRDKVLLPSNPFTKAAQYALAREAALRVFLEYPDVPLDTNHLERELRVIALGRKNWLFCWTEIGAEYVGIFQSLLVTCRLHGIDPYTYLVDVLQRIDQHPAADVAQLTPRLWKQHFAANPLRSRIDPEFKHVGS